MRVNIRISASVLVALASLLALTACDPPMPPEVAAALAEQTMACESGTANVGFATSMTSDLTSGWADNLTYSDCANIMSLVPSNSFTNQGAIVSDYQPTATDCEVSAQVPFAVDAGVLLYQLTDLSTFSISKKSAQGILTGTITNWNDPALAKDNGGIALPDLPIKLRATADGNALSSFSGWVFGTGNYPALKVSKVVETDSAKFAPLAEGEIAIAPNSFAVALGLYPASVLVGSDPNNSADLANPDAAGILSAGTQWVASTVGKNVSVKLDPNLAPTPPDGVDIVAAPYQAIYPVNFYICQDTKLNRAIGRYLLRLDSQGSLGASNYTQLSEPVRDTALLTISAGLPSPSPLPTN